ncbi:hypothetical protein O3P69_018885, partial [Scylla paramamosain]
VEGRPLQSLRTKTAGSPLPLAGRWEGAVWVNTTWAAVSLAQWSEGGCPINQYSVVYRQTSAVTWIVVSKRVEGGRPV